MKLTALALAPLFLGLAGCHSASPSEDPTPASSDPHVGEATAERQAEATPIAGTGPGPDGMDWSAVTPMEFLEQLARQETPLFTVWESPPADWIDRDDVEELLPYIHSEEPATGVNSALSSNLPLASGEDGSSGFTTSTVGREAAFLIEGYRAGKFPPRLCSQTYYDHNPKALEAWWLGEP